MMLDWIVNKEHPSQTVARGYAGFVVIALQEAFRPAVKMPTKIIRFTSWLPSFDPLPTDSKSNIMAYHDLSKVPGKYHLVKQEHFEDFLKAIGQLKFWFYIERFIQMNVMIHAGVGLAKRALAMAEYSHIDCEIHDDGEWVIHIKGLRDTLLKFKIGTETPERVTEDGRKVKVKRIFRSFFLLKEKYTLSFLLYRRFLLGTMGNWFKRSIGMETRRSA